MIIESVFLLENKPHVERVMDSDELGALGGHLGQPRAVLWRRYGLRLSALLMLSAYADEESNGLDSTSVHCSGGGVPGSWGACRQMLS
jgi:hypothetical protein